ncbi:MAG: helix-turn-helix domain-containing protein [Desulfomonilaceae bacterium]|nr:helix-turn-helix domain-containing protein [Desulfomonilaceae bacterium]
MIEQHSENHGDSSSIERLLTASRVACILGVSPKTVHKLVRERKMSCVQVTARERRFTHEQVQEYIRSQSTEVRVDKKVPRAVQSPPKKGGAKSAGDVGTDLVKEIRSLCR